MLLPKNITQHPESEAEQLQFFTVVIRSEKHQSPLPTVFPLTKERKVNSPCRCISSVCSKRWNCFWRSSPRAEFSCGAFKEKLCSQQEQEWKKKKRKKEKFSRSSCFRVQEMTNDNDRLMELSRSESQKKSTSLIRLYYNQDAHLPHTNTLWNVTEDVLRVQLNVGWGRSGPPPRRTWSCGYMYEHTE